MTERSLAAMRARLKVELLVQDLAVVLELLKVDHLEYLSVVMLAVVMDYY